MKKQMILGIGVLLIAVMVTAYYFSFPVKEDGSNLEQCIDHFYDRGYNTEDSQNIKLYDSVVLGRNNYRLADINDQLSVVKLVQGMTGAYKINGVSSGTGNFREEIIQSNEKKYLLFGGRNTSLEIASITFVLEGHHYSLDIPAKNHFFVCMEVDPRIQLTHLDLNSLKFYNTQGQDMTEQVDWNGAGPN